MKKSIHIFIIIVVLFVLGNLIIQPVETPTVPVQQVQEVQVQTPQLITYSQSDIALEFEYKADDTGYTIDERMPVDLGEDLIKTIILKNKKDIGQESPVDSEEPPVISISVFSNEQNLKAELWANNNPEDSAIALKNSETEVVSIGGVNAIQYMSDGLYSSDTIVVNHQGFIYVIRGQFVDIESDIRKDFISLIESIRFIPVSDDAAVETLSN